LIGLVLGPHLGWMYLMLISLSLVVLVALAVLELEVILSTLEFQLYVGIHVFD
jgi:hypothetical protein